MSTLVAPWFQLVEIRAIYAPEEALRTSTSFLFLQPPRWGSVDVTLKAWADLRLGKPLYEGVMALRCFSEWTGALLSRHNSRRKPENSVDAYGIQGH